MVKEAYLRDLGEGGEPFGELEVCLAGLGVARRMVVRDHDGHRAPLERLLEYVAGEGRSGVRRAARDSQRLADGAVLVVQQECVEILLVVARREDGLEHFIGGIWIWLTHVFYGLIFCVTIIGIPFGKMHFRLAKLALSPFGKELV